MKTVKDPAALNELALRTGAKVTDESGKSFNTQKRKAVAPKRLEPLVPLPEPKPEPPPPPESDPAIIAVGKNIVEASKSNVMMLTELKKQIGDIQLMSAEPVTRWEFEFIRDDKGYLQRCIANGSPDVKRLN